MSFSLPAFSIDYLEFFYVCARLNDPSSELVAWIGELDSDHVETSYESDRGTAWIIAIANLVDKDESDWDDDGDDSTYIHFHISCAVNSFFDGSKDGKEPPHTRDQLEEFCKHFDGKQLAIVRVESKFVVPESELPEVGIANLLGTKATVGGEKVVIDSLRSRFVDSHQPHTRIEWTQQKKSGNIIVRLLTTDRDVIVTDGYLKEIQESLSQTLDRFILEKEGDVDA